MEFDARYQFSIYSPDVEIEIYNKLVDEINVLRRYSSVSYSEFK